MGFVAKSIAEEGFTAKNMANGFRFDSQVGWSPDGPWRTSKGPRAVTTKRKKQIRRKPDRWLLGRTERQQPPWARFTLFLP